jgi:hypothetical protein
LKNPASFVLVARLPATYQKKYASVAGLPAASLDGLFEQPERPKAFCSGLKPPETMKGKDFRACFLLSGHRTIQDVSVGMLNCQSSMEVPHGN